GDDVLDVGEALQVHEVPHHHGAGGAELLQIVAGEVDQHQVLGALLRVGEQLCAERLVLLRGGPAGPRTRDRMGGGRGTPHTDQRFRARTDDVDGLALRVDGAQQVHVRTGVHAPQHAVDVQRVRGDRQREPLGGDDLEDLAVDDVADG